jgi:hypothetical protein
MLVLSSEDLFNDMEEILKIVTDFLNIEPISNYPSGLKKNKGNYQTIPEDIKRSLDKYFYTQNKILEKLINQKFPWY